MGPDVIHLHGLEFYAYHGVMPEENTLGQKFIVDIDLYFQFEAAGLSDNVNDTVSYAEVYKTIKSCVTEHRFQLLERLSEYIAQEVLSKHNLSAVRVEVHKPQAPIPGIFRDVSIEIWREKK